MQIDIKNLQSGNRRLSDEILLNREQIDKNTKICETIRDQTGVFISFLNEMNTAFKFFKALMTGIKILLKYVVVPIVAIIAGAYMITHNGQVPAWFKAFLVILGG